VGDLYDSFRCLGAECSDTCCIGWRVAVDQATYDKYRACADAELGPRLRQLVTINAEPTSYDYASIQTVDSSCPFLSEKLCSIQARLGEEYLSRTCALYPRVTNVVKGVAERSLDLSCPEAARLVLTDENPISLHPRADADEELKLRERILSTLQDRQYSLSERLALVVGNAAHALQPADPVLQLKIVLELIVKRVRLDYTPQRYLDLYKEFARGLGIDKSSTWAAMGARYAAAERDYYAPFMANQPDLLGRYLACYAHKTMFPVGSPIIHRLLGPTGAVNPMASQFQLMLAHYAVIRAVLIGLTAWHKSAFSTKLAIEAIQACSRTLEHCMTYPPEVKRILQERRIASLNDALVIAIECNANCKILRHSERE
jgi:lysine-N-methylase